MKARVLIIYMSVHHGNTRKVAEEMARVLNARLATPDEVAAAELLNYDLIGFGSGIYHGKHHRAILELVDRLPNLGGRRWAFIFSTRGFGPYRWYHRTLRGKLMAKGFKILGEFSCKGFDTYGIIRWIGGINKGRPDENDLKEARRFAMGVMEKLRRMVEGSSISD